MKNLCENCQHWLKKENDDIGQCRRYPPLASKSVERRIMPIFVTTHKDDWCGEFVSKEAVEELSVSSKPRRQNGKAKADRAGTA